MSTHNFTCNVTDGQEIGLNPTFTWDATSHYGYVVRFGVRNYTNVIYNDTFDESYSPPTLLPSREYELRISIQTKYTAPQQWENHVIYLHTPYMPQAFSLASPSNNSTNKNLSETLSWAASEHADNYKVYVGSDNPPTNFINGASQSSRSKSIVGLSYDTKYYWRIKAENSNGSIYSSTWNFTTKAAPKLPHQAITPSPAHDQELSNPLPRDTNLGWVDGDDVTTDPATSYDVYFGTNHTSVDDADNASGEFRGNQTSLSYSLPALAADQTYYWRIDAKNAQGAAKGEVWAFVTVDIPLGTPVEKNYRKRLIALSDNKFWYENNSGEMISLVVSGLDTSKKIAVQSAYQKVFMVNGSIKKVVDFSNTQLTISSVSDICKRGTILMQSSNGGRMSVDYIDKANKRVYGFVYAGSFVAGAVDWKNEDGEARTYSIVADGVSSSGEVPKVYDWGVYPDNDDDGEDLVNGRMPISPSIVRLYRGRIVLSGDPNSPHIDYMSEMGNPFNFAYAGESSLTAIASSGGYQGQIGEMVTAIIPYKDDYMVIGGSQGIWLQRGDPASGGSRGQVSGSIGIMSDTSWCWGDKGLMYFMDSNGIYVLQAGSFDIVSLSADKYPDFSDEFEVDESLHRITMAYDVKNNGILITKTYMDTGENQNFWFDLRTNALFPEVYPQQCAAFSSHYYNSTSPEKRKLYLGCKDGYLRVFDSDVKTDEVSDSHVAIDSNVVVGPVDLSKSGLSKAMIERMQFVCDGEIDYSIYCGRSSINTLEDVACDNSKKSGVVDGSRRTLRPRVSGDYCAIKLSSAGYNKSFVLEKIACDILRKGVLR